MYWALVTEIDWNLSELGWLVGRVVQDSLNDIGAPPLVLKLGKI